MGTSDGMVTMVVTIEEELLRRIEAAAAASELSHDKGERIGFIQIGFIKIFQMWMHPLKSQPQ